MKNAKKKDEVSEGVKAAMEVEASPKSVELTPNDEALLNELGVVGIDPETGELLETSEVKQGSQPDIAMTFDEALAQSMKSIEETYGLTQEVRDVILASQDKVVDGQEIIRDNVMELKTEIQKIDYQIEQLQAAKAKLNRQIFTLNTVGDFIVSAFDNIVREIG